MNANPVLMQKKYTRVVELFAQKAGLTLDDALKVFYHSDVYDLMSDGISNMHCMSDIYLADDLLREFNENKH